MAHRTARLNQYGRQLLIDRVLGEGWTVATAAEAQGISRATGHKWVRRYRLEGPAGLADRSSRPRRSPGATPAHEVARIVAARLEWRWGPDRLGPLLGLPPSTVGAVLRRSGMPRLVDIDRPTGLPVRRYEVCHPGALVHQDHKKLGRIPMAAGTGCSAGPTHRATIGPASGTTTSRWSSTIGAGARSSSRSLTRAVPARRSRSRRRSRYSRPRGSRSNAVLTDNGWAYRSAAYRAVLGARRHSRTRPYRPQTNGKAERFIGTLVREWAYARPYRSNTERLAALPAFVDFYNQRRPHRALGGLSPSAVVNNVRGDHS